MRSPAQPVFLSTLESILNQGALVTEDTTLWQDIISIFRRQLTPSLEDDHQQFALAEDLWHQARVVIDKTVQRMQAYQGCMEKACNRIGCAVRSCSNQIHQYHRYDRILSKELPC
jgi:hypothetical protein